MASMGWVLALTHMMLYCFSILTVMLFRDGLVYSDDEAPAAPATVCGESSAICHWKRSFREGDRPALTRKPGDLPVAVVFRADRVSRADGGKPA